MYIFFRICCVLFSENQGIKLQDFIKMDILTNMVMKT